MAQTIKLRRSATAGATPTTSQLELGEVAINTYDGKMYIKKSVGGTESIVELGSGLTPADAILEEYLYTATASQTAFSGNDDNSDFLSYTAGALQVFLNGILLDPETDYTATNGALITLTAAAAVNDYLQIFAFKKKIGDSSITINTFTGNNSTTAYTLTLDPGDENNTRVFIDGVYQSKSNYTVSGTTLTFSSAPPSGTGIEVEIGNRAVSLDTASNLDLPDNVKLRLGSSQDLEIYHTGSNSIIKDSGTGALAIQGSSVNIDKSDGSEYMAQFIEDGAASLYHNGSKKFETTSTGVNITGNIVVSGTVDGRDVASDGAAAVAALPKAGGAMTGAITTNSTFDGRDVATDGTKLDGIETAATADQTQSEINALGITATGLSGTPAISVANITTTGELRGPASLVIDPAGIGDNTGTVVIKGNLQVDGSQTTINSTTVTVDDLNLTLASGAANGTAANGAGITIDGASATLTYQSTGDNWAFNKALNVTGTVTADGLVVDGGGSRQYINAGHLRLSDGYKLEWGGGTNYISGSNSTGNISVVATGDITLDADGGEVVLKDGSVTYGHLKGSTSDFIIQSLVSDKDIIFKGLDGAAIVTALTLDMSNAGAATFNSSVTSTGLTVNSGSTSSNLSIRNGSNSSFLNIYSDLNGVALLDVDGANVGAAPRFQIDVGNVQTFRITEGGDISFYENTGTTPKLFWDSSASSLGIGTTAVSSFAINDLVVGSGSSVHGMTIYTGTSHEGIIRFADGTSGIQQYAGQVKYNHSNDSLNFYTNGSGTSRLALDSSGNATFSGSVSAEDNIYLTDSGTVRAKLLLNASDRDNVELRAESLGSTMKLFTVGTEALAIDASQNVNIPNGSLMIGSTTAPSYPLHVDAAGMGDIYSGLIQNSTTDTDHYNVVRFIQGASGSATGYIGTGGSATSNPAFRNSFVVGTQTSSPLVFATNDTERARIDASGRVGIKTTPSAWGTDYAVLDLNTGGSIYGTTSGVTTSSNLYFTGSAWIAKNTGLGTLYAQHTGKHLWYSSGSVSAGSGAPLSQKMELSASGNLGIGVSSPDSYPAGATTGSLSFRLEEVGMRLIFKAASGNGHAGISTIDQSGAGLMIGANTYVNSGGSVVYGRSDHPSSGIYFDGWSGDRMRFYTGASGNPTERMSILADGNVGIGESNPAQKLDVAGRIKSDDGLLSNHWQVYNTGTDGFLIQTSVAANNYGHIHGEIKLQRFNANTQQIINFSATVSSIAQTVHTKAATADIDVTIKMFVYGGVWCFHVPSPSTYTDISAYIHLGAGYQGGSRSSNVISSLSHTGVPSSGVTNSVDIVAQKRILANTSGNVGIGTDSPAEKLDVNGNIRIRGTSGRLYFDTLSAGSSNFVGTINNYETVVASGRGSAGFGVFGNSDIRFGFGTTRDSSETDLYISNSDGKVGIGTTSPTHKLHIVDGNNYAVLGDTQSNSTMSLRMADSATSPVEVQAYSSELRFNTASTSGATPTVKMNILAGGNVGIGTTSPGYKLEISDDTNGTVNLLKLRNADSTYSQTWDFQLDTSKHLVITGGSGSGGIVLNPGTTGTTVNSGLYVVSNNSSNAFTVKTDHSGNPTALQIGGAGAINGVSSANQSFTILNVAKDSGSNKSAYFHGHVKTAGVYNTTHTSSVGHETSINILNNDPVDGGSDFDQTPTNNVDGGGTTWSISGSGDAIYFENTSGGHGGTWMKVNVEQGYYVIKGTVRLTNTDQTNIHSSTSTANYKYTHSFRFEISGGPDTGHLKWDADAIATANGTDFTRAGFCSGPVYMAAGNKNIVYNTNGYNGVQQIYITNLELVRIG